MAEPCLPSRDLAGALAPIDPGHKPPDACSQFQSASPHLGSLFSPANPVWKQWLTAPMIVEALTSFSPSWLQLQAPYQPPSGTMLFYNKSICSHYRKDGYSWRKESQDTQVPSSLNAASHALAPPCLGTATPSDGRFSDRSFRAPECKITRL